MNNIYIIRGRDEIIIFCHPGGNLDFKGFSLTIHPFNLLLISGCLFYLRTTAARLSPFLPPTFVLRGHKMYNVSSFPAEGGEDIRS